MGSPLSLSGGIIQERGGKTSHFIALNINISKTVGDTSKDKTEVCMLVCLRGMSYEFE